MGTFLAGAVHSFSKTPPVVTMVVFRPIGNNLRESWPVARGSQLPGFRAVSTRHWPPQQDDLVEITPP
jgi:hypothetical protein